MPAETISMQYNESGFDLPRNNIQGTLLASAARTATVSSPDQTNYNGRGVHVVLDVTDAGTGSVTLAIEGNDPASGNYYAILTGAAVTTVELPSTRYIPD